MDLHDWSTFILFILVAIISTTLIFTVSVESGAVSAIIGLVGCWLYRALIKGYFE